MFIDIFYFQLKIIIYYNYLNFYQYEFLNNHDIYLKFIFHLNNFLINNLKLY